MVWKGKNSSKEERREALNRAMVRQQQHLNHKQFMVPFPIMTKLDLSHLIFSTRAI